MNDSVLFFGTHGTGPVWYGTPPQEGSDPDRSDKGYHAYPYRAQVWAYSAADLLLVKNGSLQPWEVQPYGVWSLPLPGSPSDPHFGGAAWDAASRRLYISQRYADSWGKPRIHVFDVI